MAGLNSCDTYSCSTRPQSALQSNGDRPPAIPRCLFPLAFEEKQRGRRLGLTEEAGTDGVVEGHFWSAENVVGDAGEVFGDKGKGFLAAESGFGRLFLKDLAEPEGGGVTVLEVDVMLLGVAVAGHIPV